MVYKPVLVEALIVQLSVEALIGAILHGFARCDELKRDAVLIGPRVESSPSKLGSIADQNASRVTGLPCGVAGAQA